MTNEEAIKILKVNAVISPKATEFCEAVKIAVAAIEKQMPQKLLRKLFCAKYYSLMCPYCNGPIMGCYGKVAPRYCSHCGQALDWKGGITNAEQV